LPQAIPGRTSSTPPASYTGANGQRAGKLLRVVSNSQLQKEDADRRAAAEPRTDTVPQTDLSSYIRQQWNVFRNNRNQGIDALNDRLLRAQRMFDGKYDPDKLAAIARFGGSQVYSRLVAVKCRGATSLLRDVYLGPDRPWDIDPVPDPPVPDSIKQNIITLVDSEVKNQQATGNPVPAPQIHMRLMGLMHAAQQAARRSAEQQASNASNAVDDILRQGRFYEALGQFLIDLPLFPFACIKGPTVRMVPQLVYQNGKPLMKQKARMFWERVSPFNVYWSPGVSNIEDANIIERKRLTRTDITSLIGLPGYDQDAIRGVLDDYGRGLRDWLDSGDAEQAMLECRENPNLNQTEMIDGLEFHGNVRGEMLLNAGMSPELVTDPLMDYSVQTYIIGRYTIKTQLNPSPRMRHPYFVTSFEKCPGTVAGHGLPDLLEDLQESCNAALRSLINNMSIASGPQVVVNDEAIAPTENGDDLYPWKRWHIQMDPMGTQREPITFFQPQSNAQELLAVYNALSGAADEISAIPKYLSGSQQGLAGAGRTASGLSMLMGNSEKVLQTVAANVDTDVMNPLLTAVYDMIMLTDTSGMLTGDEQITVKGVDVAVQKETERSKQLQFLQITANPIDAPIIGELGRARVLRAVAEGLGLPDDIVPDDQTIQAKMDAQQQMAQAGAQLQTAANPNAPPVQPGQPPSPPSAAGKGGPGGTVANMKPQVPPGMIPQSAGSPGAQAQGQQAPMAQGPNPGQVAPPVNLMQQGLPA
jgi:hypothetical protein